MHQESKKAVFAALAGNFSIAVCKVAAALISGSSTMLAEGFHSISDTFNQILLLLGLRRGEKSACPAHPFGFGKEQFFWSFVVAIILFGVAGVLSIVEGLHKLRHPEPLRHIWLNYLVIAFSLVFEAIALRIAVIQVRAEMKRDKQNKWLRGLKESKNPVTMTVLVEDSLALLGLVIAAVALTLVHLTGKLVFDAAASIIIGVLLMFFALFLANETRGLLVGESVSPSRRKELLRIMNSFAEIKRVISLKTMHLSAEEVLVAAELNYRDDLTADEMARVNNRLEEKIKLVIPRSKIYLEAEDGPERE